MMRLEHSFPSDLFEKGCEFLEGLEKESCTSRLPREEGAGSTVDGNGKKCPEISAPSPGISLLTSPSVFCHKQENLLENLVKGAGILL